METTYNLSTFIKGNSAGHSCSLIYIRITVNGERAEISVKRKIDPSRWDSKAGRVKGNKEDAREINYLVDSTILKLNKIHNSLAESNEFVTADLIKEIFNGNNAKGKKLLEVFKEHNEWLKERIGIDYALATYRRFVTTSDHVTTFLRVQYGLNEIPLRSIKYSFVTDLEHFLKVTRKCNHNSTQKYIRIFRRIINKSVVNGWIERDPFAAYKVKLKESRRVFLNTDELKILETKVI
jgi:hypothetical protein